MVWNCEIIPTVDKKPSKLYQGLLERTANNRPLTNLLYALSKHKIILNMFDKAQKDSLGEIKVNDFVKHFKVDELIPTESKLKVLKEELGIIDDKGMPVIYDNPNTILDKVLEFNDTHEAYAARIEKVGDGYQVQLDTINAKNYMQNYYHKRNKARYDRFNSYLNSVLGVNTKYSESLVKEFNFMTIQDIINFLTSRNRNSTTLREFRNNTQIQLVKEWFHDDSRLKRLQNGLSEEQLNRLFMYESLVDQEDSNIDLSDIEQLDYWRTLANSFLQSVNSSLNSINQGNLISKLQEAETAVEADRELLGVPVKELKEILSDLYDRFHLDTEAKNTSNKDLKTLKDVAEKMINSRKKAIRLLRNDAELKEEVKKIKQYEQELNQAEYAHSIYSMLQEMNNTLMNLSEEHTFEDKEDVNAKSEALRAKAAYLNEISTFLEENSDIIDRLIDAKSIQESTKGVIQDESLVEAISSTAKDMRETCRKLTNYYIQSRYTTAYEIIKPYWGDDDIKLDNKGNAHSLQAILEIARGDVNAIDRWLLSAGNCSDELVGLIHQMFLTARRKTIDRYRDVEYIMNEATEKLYQSGSDSKFCYEFDENGVPTGNLISDIDWNGWKNDIKKYREQLKNSGKYTNKQINSMVENWKRNNLKNTILFKDSSQYQTIYEETLKELYGDNIPERLKTPRTFTLPNEKYRTNKLNNLTQAQREYYYKMMAIKSILSDTMPFSDTKIFKAVQIAGDTLNQIETAGNPLEFIKNKIKDRLERREDDTDYGTDELDDMLAASGMTAALSDANGHEIKRIPMMYTRDIKDKRRLATNMSRAMNAWSVAALQYEELNKISDQLLLLQDYITDHKNGRQVQARRGGKGLIDVYFFGKDMNYNPITEKGGLSSDALVYDLYERALYGKLKKKETVHVFGLDINADKVADLLTAYTSTTGLAINFMGAQANYLVGKLQMIIDGGSGEFFNLKDYAVADLKYFQMLPELMNELNSNNKKSLLALLGNFFDVTDDFIERVKEKGFNKEALKRILANPNLFFLYGLGEHPLHFQTMLAVLNHTKVRNKNTGVESSILDVFKVITSESGKNGKLDVNYNDYELMTSRDKSGNATYEPLTAEHLDRLRKIIKHCNNTMHGAFGTLDKGMAHRYAAWRLALNFRQWMPAHYARRFQGRYYDSDLGEYREGYYRTCFKFIGDIVTDKNLRFNIKANWAALSESDKANMKRACTEVLVYTMLCAQIATLGTYKDKKGNWAYRNLQYQLRRLRVETGASMPGPNFFSNALQILNSPIPAISALEKASTLFNFTNLYKEVEGGKHRGENLYLHKLEMSSPVYGQFRAQFLDFATEDYLFNPFEKGY